MTEAFSGGWEEQASMDSARLLGELRRENIEGPGGYRSAIEDEGLYSLQRLVPVLMAWAQFLALSGRSDDVMTPGIDTAHASTWHPQALAMIDAAADAADTGIDVTAALAPTVDEITRMDDPALWELTWSMAWQARDLADTIGGTDRLAAAIEFHQRYRIPGLDEGLLSRAAMVVAAVTAGHLRDANEMLVRLLAEHLDRLGPLLGQWLVMTAMEVGEVTHSLLVDWDGALRGIGPPGDAGGDVPADDAVVHAAIRAAIGLYHRDGFTAAVEPLAALTGVDRMAATWQLAAALGLHLAGREATSRAAEPDDPDGRWLILDHRTLGLDTPVVYLPEAALAPHTADDFGFIACPTPDNPTVTVPQTRGLSVGVDDADQMTLFTTTLPDEDPPPEHLVTVQARPLTTRPYLHPATSAWRKEARARQAVCLITGTHPDHLNTPARRLMYDSGTRMAAAPVGLHHDPPSPGGADPEHR